MAPVQYTKLPLMPWLDDNLGHTLVTDWSSVLPSCAPNRKEQVNQSFVSQTETEQNWTCKKRIKT